MILSDPFFSISFCENSLRVREKSLKFPETVTDTTENFSDCSLILSADFLN